MAIVASFDFNFLVGVGQQAFTWVPQSHWPSPPWLLICPFAVQTQSNPPSLTALGLCSCLTPGDTACPTCVCTPRLTPPRSSDSKAIAVSPSILFTCNLPLCIPPSRPPKPSAFAPHPLPCHRPYHRHSASCAYLTDADGNTSCRRHGKASRPGPRGDPPRRKSVRLRPQEPNHRLHHPGMLAGGSGSLHRRHMLTMTLTTGRYHHHLLPTPPPPSLQDQTTKSYCRSHWGDHPRSVRHGTYSRLHKCHFPCSVHARLVVGCQRWTHPVSLLGGA